MAATTDYFRDLTETICYSNPQRKAGPVSYPTDTKNVLSIHTFRLANQQILNSSGTVLFSVQDVSNDTWRFIAVFMSIVAQDETTQVSRVHSARVLGLNASLNTLGIRV